MRGRPLAVRFAASAIIAVFLGLALASAWGEDVTYDERDYFGAGRSILITGEWTGTNALRHPPLSFYVSNLPLFFFGKGDLHPYGAALRACRATSLVFFGVPLLLAVFLWARDLFGPPAGLMAICLAAFCPTLLAHARLTTADLALTSSGFVSSYLFWRYMKTRTPLWLAAWSAALGLTLLCKTSAWLFVLNILLLGAIGMAKLAIAPASTSPRHLTTLNRSLRGSFPILAGLAGALLVVNLGYGFSGLFDAAGKAALIAKVPASPYLRAAAWASAQFFPLPYLQTAASQLRIEHAGWPGFLMGRFSRTGWWYYFGVAFLIKQTLPFLLLFGASAARLRKSHGALLDELSIVLPPVLFFGFMSVGRVNIGIRYLLPALPFLFVFTARLAAPWSRTGFAARCALVLMLAWHAAAGARAFPDYLAYFNELIGGNANGYKYLVDSNLDWGQNRTFAKAFAHDRGILFEPETLPASGQVLVCANELQGILNREKYRRLREEYEPVGLATPNWLIFDLGRNRRIPEEDVVSVLSGPGWRVHAGEMPGWSAPEVDEGSWSVARPADPPDVGSLDPSAAFPGTEAKLLRCEGTGAPCCFRAGFVLERAAAGAVLHLGTSASFDLFLNGAHVGSERAGATGYRREEFSVAKLLHTGKNVISVRVDPRDAATAADLVLEMRIAQMPSERGVAR